jgi:hypothetical protein
MAVVGTAFELAEGRRGFSGENGVRGYVRVFGVETNNAHDDKNIVLAANGIPGMYLPYISGTTTDFGARVIDQEAVQDPRSRLFWRVTVTYSSQFERIENPFLEPPDIDFDSENYKEPLPGIPSQFSRPGFTLSTPPDDPEELATQASPNQNLIHWGKGILNSAGHPYNPPAEQEASRPVVRYTRNEASFTVAFKIQYENSVNNAAWNGLTDRQAWLRSIRATAQVWKSTDFSTADVTYYRVTYEFVLKQETWDLQLLDYGPYYLDWSSGGIAQGTTPTRYDFTTNTGAPRMGLLDNSDSDRPGRKLAENGTPCFNRYPTRRQTNFADINISLNLALTDVKTRNRS